MSQQDHRERYGLSTRRKLLRDAGTVAAGATLLSLPAGSGALARKGRRKQTVAVFGGGVAGLTAAHELIERGFEVTVYEKRAWGGKARSTKVPDSARGGRKQLPGEHGFRVIFGFYHNLPDTVRRIPYGSNPNGVFDNMTPGTVFNLSRRGGGDLAIPTGIHEDQNYGVPEVRNLLLGLLQAELPPAGVAYLADRLTVYLSSCDARRFGQWEETAWADFIAADKYGADYKKILGGLATVAQASKAEKATVNWLGATAEMLVYNLAGIGSTGPFDRPLNGPTNETWIKPWIRHLRKLGVKLRLGEEVTELEYRDHSLAGARVGGRGGERRVQADWYIVALPSEGARRLWSARMKKADSRLGPMRELESEWMTGLQFYLRERTPLVHGHSIYVDAPWAISSISQAQFWDRDFAREYGDGQVRDCLSAIVSNWYAPGGKYGKAAQDLPPKRVARSVWEEIKQHADGALSDDLLHSWALDPGMVWKSGEYHNEDPLSVPHVGNWKHRPEAAGEIENLILAGDYLKGDALVGTMEAANEAGRRGANAILERSSSRESPAEVMLRYRPPEFDPLKRIDEDRYRRGLPNQFDLG